ncbi:hypothetical protein DMUE_1108 [Dictyocoela muelleri]|nr:hypothetical protein DMUE_1108 [Dictyocoela muelleri]
MTIGILDKNFTETEELFSFLIENEIIKGKIQCSRCDEKAHLGIISVKGIKTLIYRCKKICRQRISIINSKLKLNKLVHVIFLVLSGANYNQLNLFMAFPIQQL